MRKITQKLLLLMLTVLCTSAFAQVTPTGFWNRVGDVSSHTVYTDTDNGDGAADGALKIVGKSAVVGQGILFDFDGTMQNGITYTIDTVIYNDASTNSCTVKIILWNKTDNVQLAVANGGANYNLNSTNALATVNFSYTATATDVGDVLELRYIRADDGAVSRMFCIDFAKLNTTTITDSFPPALPITGTWSPILNGAGSVQLLPATNDANNGDGVADGAVKVDGLLTVTGIGAAYAFNQPMETGKTYEFGTTVYNTNSSFCNLGSWSLWNKTDNLQRAVYVSSNINIIANTGLFPLKYFYYTAVAEDNGDVMELRYITNDATASRDFWIDNITLNGVIIDLKTSGSLSLEERELDSKIQLWPNPSAQGQFNVLNAQNTNDGASTIEISTVNGQVIYSKKSNPGTTTTIQTNDWASGVYILKATNNGTQTTKKLIIQ